MKKSALETEKVPAHHRQTEPDERKAGLFHIVTVTSAITVRRKWLKNSTHTTTDPMMTVEALRESWAYGSGADKLRRVLFGIYEKYMTEKNAQKERMIFQKYDYVLLSNLSLKKQLLLSHKKIDKVGTLRIKGLLSY